MKVFITQSCPTLCGPMDCSPPGSSVHGILQARIYCRQAFKEALQLNEVMSGPVLIPKNWCPHTKRKKHQSSLSTTWRRSRKVTVCKPGRTPSLSRTWPHWHPHLGTYSLQNCEKINCCQVTQVYGVVLRQSKLTNKMFHMPFGWGGR